MFLVEELRGQTMGIIGLGDIGYSTAKIAKAFKMKVIGIRRNPIFNPSDKDVIVKFHGKLEFRYVEG